MQFCSSRCVIVLVTLLTANVCPAAFIAPRLFWTDAGGLRIHHSYTDGSDEQSFITASGTGGYQFGWDVAVDATTSRLYWSIVDGGSSGLIRRAEFDGSGQTNVADFSTGEPLGIFLDVNAGMMYAGGDAPAQVMRADVNSGGVTQLFPVAYPPASKVGDVALDLPGQKIYYAEHGVSPDAGSIRRANLNGSNIETLVSDLTEPWSLALDLAGEKMYWVDRFEGKVQRSNLDGTLVETLASPGFGVRGIALDLQNGHLFWSTGSGIVRADLNGANPFNLPVTGGANGMTVLSYVPEPSSLMLIASTLLLRRRLRHGETRVTSSARAARPKSPAR